MSNELKEEKADPSLNDCCLERPLIIKNVHPQILCAIVLMIGAIVLIAAFGKFFYPAKGLKIFDRIISGLEILFVFGIIYFRKKIYMWLLAAIVFASWFGYALFWFRLELPCSCMGELVKIPTLLSLTLDSLFFLASLAIAFLGSTRSSILYLTVLGGFFMALSGYALAGWIYQTYLLGAKI